jgi:uncharacterized membrane protein (UPF0127 family)
MRRAIFVMMLGAILVVGCTQPVAPVASVDEPALPQGHLTGCGADMRLDIVSTPALRSRGLMARHTLPDHYGMLFVFPAPTMPSFWMHNTPTALDIVFLSDSGTILAIEAMTPNSDDRHTAPEPVRYALEVAQGYFASQSVAVGQQCTLTIPADLVIE